MTHVIRPARSSDADDIASIHHASWLAAYADTGMASLMAGLDPQNLALEWARAIITPPSPTSIVLIAVEDERGGAGGTPVGFTALSECQDPEARGECELIALHVAPDHQRAGHGSRLLAAAIDAMDSRGFTDAICWVPLVEEPRRAFLMSAGWAPDGALRDLQMPDGGLLREARLVVSFGPEPAV